MNRARLLLTVFVYLLVCLPTLHAAEADEFKRNCESLVKSLRDLTPLTREIVSMRRSHQVFPWVGVTEHIIEPGQSLDPFRAHMILTRLESIQKLLIQMRDQGLRLSSGQRRGLMETVALATSAYYSSLNIPHSVEKITSMLGQNVWRIKVNPQSDSTIPIVELANLLARADTRLQIDFNLVTTGEASAAFEEGAQSTTPLLDSPVSSILKELSGESRSSSRLSLPFRMAYLPDSLVASVGLMHELRHWENSLRKIQHQNFPFYGVVLFPFGLGEIFNAEPEKSSLFLKIYGRLFSLEENDTLAENFFNLGKILDLPLASFNRELGEESLQRDFEADSLSLSMANRLSTAIGEAVLLETDKDKSEREIQFSVKSGMVWARVISKLKPGVLKAGFVLSVPLVRASPDGDQAEHIEMLRNQMRLMILNLQNRAKLAEWILTADSLRHDLEFRNKSYKDFLRVFLAALIHPGYSNQENFVPLTWARFSRAFRQQVQASHRP